MSTVGVGRRGGRRESGAREGVGRMGIVAPAGRVRVDCHLHTVASGDAVLTLEELAERARQTGLDVVCITDHNVTTAAVQAAERDLGVRIVVGEEIRTPDGDVIGLFLTERIPYVLPLAEVIGRIKAQQRTGLRPAPVRPGPVQPRPGASRPVRGRRGGHHRGLQRQDLRPRAELPGSRPGRPVRPTRRGGLGRARRARGRRRLSGDARLRRSGRLPRRAGGRPADRGVPRPRGALPAAIGVTATAEMRPGVGGGGGGGGCGGRDR